MRAVGFASRSASRSSRATEIRPAVVGTVGGVHPQLGGEEGDGVAGVYRRATEFAGIASSPLGPVERGRRAAIARGERVAQLARVRRSGH